VSRNVGRTTLALIALAMAAAASGIALFAMRGSGASAGGGSLDFAQAARAAGAAAHGIPAIIRPRFDSASVASRLLQPTDLVLGVDIRGDARAYPVKLLALHEAVDDEVGGRPIAVTWCPLCASAAVFDRRVAGRVLTFAVTGRLHHANQVLYDQLTHSLWSQLADHAISGPLRGRKLRLVAASEQTWRAWLAAHPRTRVLSIRRDLFASDFVHPFTYLDFRGEESSDDPYLAYEQKVSVYYGFRIDGISGASRVVGVIVDDRAKAYPEGLLAARHAVNDRLAGVPIVIVWSGLARTPAVFSRRLDGRVLLFRWSGGALDDTITGSRWNPASGRATSGRLLGSLLRPIAFTHPYWFAWRSFHPRTRIAHH
jgi:Protein of unknown function (DUF3179)